MADSIAPGSRVRVVYMPPYVKTADPMPMLRPPSVLQLGEEGLIMGRRPGNYWVVRFNRGSFLLEDRYLEVVTDDTPPQGANSGSNAQ